jgi:hypothetical protein
MKPVEPAKLMRLYEQCYITPMELRTRLVQAAASYPPETFVSLVPAEELRAIRALAESPPASPEGSPRIFAMGSWVGPHDHEAEEREERRLWYDGIWRWHRFFHHRQAELAAPADRPRD